MHKMAPEEQANLAALLRRLTLLPHEVEWVEFKHNNSDPEEIGEYLSALSNAAALHCQKTAFLVWGVEDQTHQVLGTSFRPRIRKIGNEDLEPWLARQLHPGTHFTIHEFAFDSLPVVLFEIQPCGHTPVRWKDVAYIRVGSYKKKLRDFPEKERILWTRMSQASFEKGIAAAGSSGEEVLSRIDYPAYFEMSEQAVPGSRDAILDRLAKEHLVAYADGDRWDVTNLGAILFARRLADFESIARKAVRVIVYRGKDRTVTTKEQVISRGYASGFGETIDYIADQLPRTEEIGKALRQDVRAYPEIAVRELVANALVHQDLWARGSGPMVEIFADRVEITNPGRPLIDPLRFLDEPPRSRNESLAAFLRRLKICEERGSGIDKVVSQIESFQLPAPEFRQTESHTVAILLAPKKLSSMDRKDKTRACYQHACLRFVSRETMTNASLRERLGIAEANAAIASRIIAETVEAGLVKLKDPENKSRKHAAYVPFWA